MYFWEYWLKKYSKIEFTYVLKNPVCSKSIPKSGFYCTINALRAIQSRFGGFFQKMVLFCYSKGPFSPKWADFSECLVIFFCVIYQDFLPDNMNTDFSTAAGGRFIECLLLILLHNLGLCAARTEEYTLKSGIKKILKLVKL